MAPFFLLITGVNYANNNKYFHKIINTKELEVAFKKAEVRDAFTNKEAPKLGVIFSSVGFLCGILQKYDTERGLPI